MRAVLCGYYGMGNGGDEALLATLLQLLPPFVTPIVLSGNPAETSQRYGVEAVPRKSLKAVIAALGKSQVFIWGGGSLMQDASSAINPFYYGGLMKLAQWMGLGTIAWGQGIGPLNRSSSQWITRWALQDCNAVSVRDKASAQLVKGWGIRHQLAPDPVWALRASPAESALQHLPTPRVALALRNHPLLTPKRVANISQAVADFQAKTQACIVLLPFQPSKDRALASQIAKNLSGPHEIIEISQPETLKGIFKAMDMTIAMRFHGVVMAVAEGCPCFAISYDPKVTQIMQALSLPGWGLSEEDPLPLIPNSVETMTQQWLMLYTKGGRLDLARSQINQAINHGVLLEKTLNRLTYQEK